MEAIVKTTLLRSSGVVQPFTDTLLRRPLAFAEFCQEVFARGDDSVQSRTCATDGGCLHCLEI